MCTVLVDKELFLKNRTTLAKKCPVRPSSRLKSVHLDYRSSLLVSQLLRFWFKSLQSLTAHESSSYKVTYSFWLCVHTRCLSICAPSFVAVVWCKWALQVIAFWVQNTPQTVSRNHNVQGHCVLVSWPARVRLPARNDNPWVNKVEFLGLITQKR